MKYILVALVLVIAVQIWRSNRRKAAALRKTHQAPAQQRKPEDMVTCAHCGLHLPSSDALLAPGDLTYCCSEHRQLGPQ